MNSRTFSPSNLMSVDELIRALPLWLSDILQRTSSRQPPQTVPLNQALGRYLANDVIAQLNSPRFDNSAMDGYAVCGEGLHFTVVDRIVAGQMPSLVLQPGQAARIMTGAHIPQGTQAVVMQEHVQCEGHHIVLASAAHPGQHIRRAGEDCANGQTLFQRNHLLSARDLSVLASQGWDTIQVRAQPRIGILRTGDELIAPGQPLPHLAAIYSSTPAALQPMLQAWGGQISAVRHCGDSLIETETALQDLVTQCDWVISTAGVSVGDEDHLRTAVERMGQLQAWRVAMKPGKPLALGWLTGPNGPIPYTGLPGNPVSSLVCAMLFVRPMLALFSCFDNNLQQHLNGTSPSPALWPPALYAPLNQAVQSDGKRSDFMRAKLVQGQLHAQTAQGSGHVTGLAWSDALLRIDPQAHYLASEQAAYWPLAWLESQAYNLNEALAQPPLAIPPQVSA